MAARMGFEMAWSINQLLFEIEELRFFQRQALKEGCPEVAKTIELVIKKAIELEQEITENGVKKYHEAELNSIIQFRLSIANLMLFGLCDQQS